MCARGLRFEHKDLQLALDAAAKWAKSWRFHFAAGPQKSAVMCFGRGRARLPEFHVDGLALPVVKSYKYLRIVLQSNLGLRQHVDGLLSRGEGQAAWVHRWSGILSVAAQRAFAASLLELPPAAELGAAGDPPALHELLADARWLQAPVNMASQPAQRRLPCTGTLTFAVVKRCVGKKHLS